MALERLFAWLDRVLASRPEAVGAVAPPPLAWEPPARPAMATHHPVPSRALLSVDGGGQHLLCGADRLSLGHRRAGRADLSFLADVGPLHAELVRADSLQHGPGWRLVPFAGESCTLDGRAVPVAGVRVEPGGLVRLGRNLEFRLHQPDAASASVVLELLRGVECDGARHVLLLAPEAGGRVRIGASVASHVRVQGLELEVDLEWRGQELELRGDELLEGLGDAEPRGRCVVAFPPPERVELTCGRPRGSRPPFALSIEPVLRPAPGAQRPPAP